MSSITQKLRRYLVAGLIVITPVGLTAFVLVWLFRTVDSILGTPLQRALGYRIHGVGLVLLVVIILLVGWIVHLTAGRKLVSLWNRLLLGFPLAGRVYSATSQIVQAMLSGQRRVFRRAVLIPYPTKGLWAIAFITSEDSLIGSAVTGEPYLNVFVPTTPNPTSGFLLMVPKSRVVPLDLPIEEAMKLVISAGAVEPKGATEISEGGLDLNSLLDGS